MLNHKSYLIANWKMSLNTGESLSFIDQFKQKFIMNNKVHVVLAPAFVSLPLIQEKITRESLQFSLSAQNVSSQKSGAFTGEISPYMLKEIGCQYVLVGHSERRNLYHEIEPDLSCKVRLAIEEGLIPVLCIGEPREVYEADQTSSYLAEQLSPYNPRLPIIIAYEPIWAIGTGLIPTFESLQKSLYMIHSLFPSTPVLYGGSVNPENVESLLPLQHLSGFLVGGASTKPASFYSLYQSMVDYYSHA